MIRRIRYYIWIEKQFYLRDRILYYKGVVPWCNPGVKQCTLLSSGYLKVRVNQICELVKSAS